jgi:hypothetical protein
VFEARNSKSEIRNNQIDQKKQNSKQEFLEFGIHNSDLCFGFVSDFELRISDFELELPGVLAPAIEV